MNIKILSVLSILLLIVVTGCTTIEYVDREDVKDTKLVSGSINDIETQEEEIKVSNIVVLQHSIKFDEGHTPEYDRYKILGEVKNEGETTENYVKIIATMYDELGKLVCTDYTYTIIDILSPGDTSPFELVFYSDDCIGFNTYNLKVD